MFKPAQSEWHARRVEVRDLQVAKIIAVSTVVYLIIASVIFN